MANFRNLVKIQLSALLNNLFFKNSVKKKRNTILLAGFVLLLILFSLGSSYYMSVETLKASNMLEFLFLQAGCLGILFVVIMVSMEASSHFFMAKDYETLASLPLKSVTIVSAKFVAILLSAYLYSTVMLLPAIVVYFSVATFSIITLLYSLIWLLFFPLLPAFISCVLGLLIAFINSRAKNPQLVSLILCGLFLLVYFLYYFNYQSLIETLVSNGLSLITSFCLIVPSAGLFLWALLGGGMGAMLIFVGINIIFGLLAILLVSALYNNINLTFKKNSGLRKNKTLLFKQTPIVKKLILKESKNYFGNTVYVMNTLIMAILGALLPIIMYFSVNNMEIGFDTTGISTLAIIFTIVMVSMPTANTACVSLSIEGERFAVLKALPLSPKLIMGTKIGFNVLVVSPFIFIAGIMCLILYFSSFTILSGILIFALPLIATFGMACFGMLMNLVYPKLKFISYTQVVKQSASSGFGIMGGILINVLPFMLYFTVLAPIISFELFLLLDLAYTLIYTCIFALILLKKGDEMFNKIQE